MNNLDLSDHLLDVVVDKMASVEGHFPGFVLPRSYAGHPVGEDAACHLLKTLTLLLELGVDEINGVSLRRRSLEIVSSVDPAIEAFASFGFGESVVRLGGLEAVVDADRVVRATRSPETLRRIVEDDHPPPPNWTVVVARCLKAEQRLTGARPEHLDDFVERTRTLLGERASGWVNDMWAPLVHYDMYTPDMYVFAEPLVDDLGGAWQAGLAPVLDDLDDLVHPGGAIVWGRSSGLLALAMTVELAAVGARHGLLAAPTPWFERAREAADRLDALLPGGINAAHQGRATMSYRGPERRLQMGFDLLDKLAAAAVELRAAPLTDGVSPSAAWAPTDRLVRFDTETTAGAWAVRSRSLSFVMPFMRGMSSDYQPALRSPGVLDNPTAGHPCFVPMFHRDGNRWSPAGAPSALDHEPGRLVVEHDDWATPGGGPGELAVAGSRRATYTVSGRTVTVAEELTVDDPAVEEVTVTVPEAAPHRLDVTVDGGATVRPIDTAGIAEWRSYWNELPRVHQIEIPVVDGAARCTWSVRPQLRVGSTIHGHNYDNALYGPLADRLHAVAAPAPGDDLFDQLGDLDVLHIGWPEWWSGVDPVTTSETITRVKENGVKVLWTQHNLLPHYFKTDDAAACYQAWAQVADAVIHHSQWGEELARSTYDYGAHTRHVVIRHGHWGHRYQPFETVTREWIETMFDWEPCAIRLAVVGSPRAEKQLQDVLDAFHATERDDMQLVIRLDGSETVPDDPRILLDRTPLSEDLFLRRMRGIDALILPFAPEGMLTTGTAFDVIGAGVAAVSSDWGFLSETFAGSDICYGRGTDDLRACLRDLTSEEVAESAAAIADRRSLFDWEPIAHQTLALLEALCP